MSTPTKSIAFLGATGGCGLEALRQSLAANYKCIALCRTPSKLTALLPPEEHPNLTVLQGNAHDVLDVTRCLVVSDGDSNTRLVDTVLFSIGGAFQPSRMTIDDPEVCQKGMEALLAALKTARQQVSSNSGPGQTPAPLIIAISTTGISTAGRDVPLLFLPLYHLMLRTPHADKRIMEERLVRSGEDFTVVRPSLLVDRGSDAARRPIRVGVEDPARAVFLSREVGYTISRDEVGRWIFEELVRDGKSEFRERAVSLTC